MKRIVLTGGPCSGKTTVISALKEEFGDRIILVPEVATILLGNGFPAPGKDLQWSEAWQAALQNAVLPLQSSIEAACELMGQEKGLRIQICDRGLLDGAAYTPGGLDAFCASYNVDKAEALKRYTAIIHLESLATVEPEKYGKMGNASRFEPLERAVELERAVRTVWAEHPRHMVINGRRGIDGKIAEVIGIIRFLLAEKEAA